MANEPMSCGSERFGKNESKKRINTRTDRNGYESPHAFPVVSTLPGLPVMITDEILELYAFLFCQGGFRQIGVTFARFLLVIAAAKPGDLEAKRHGTNPILCL